VNGWNNVVDNNTAKMVVVTGTTTFSKFAWTVDWHGGPENPNTNAGWHHLIDTTLTLTPTSKVSAYINYDYHQWRHFNDPVFPNNTLTEWQGIAAALRLQANSKWAFTGRGEWFHDRQGHATGTPQKVKEVTFTGEYKLAEGLLTRAEYRHDWSDVPFFQRGPLNLPYNKQDTFTVSFVAFFGPAR
jgi:Putative beta-barrel porin-2, OmpL-like. bbp2